MQEITKIQMQRIREETDSEKKMQLYKELID